MNGQFINRYQINYAHDIFSPKMGAIGLGKASAEVHGSGFRERLRRSEWLSIFISQVLLCYNSPFYPTDFPEGDNPSVVNEAASPPALPFEDVAAHIHHRTLQPGNVPESLIRRSVCHLTRRYPLTHIHEKTIMEECASVCTAQRSARCGEENPATVRKWMATERMEATPRVSCAGYTAGLFRNNHDENPAKTSESGSISK
jgi:hypothetical protein